MALVVGLLVGAAIGLPVGALAFDGGDPPLVPLAGTNLQRIAADPERFFGQNELVTGEVREIISHRAFTIGPPGFFGPRLLVVSKSPVAVPTAGATRPILEGDSVQVSGEVRKFDVPAFERDLGVDLKREFDTFVGDDLRGRQGDLAIRADVVTFQSRTTPVAEARTAEAVAERPTDFYGKVVSVSGRVTNVLGSGVLIVDDGLVALTADIGQQHPRKGQTVRLLGPVRPFDPDQLRVQGRELPDDDILGKLANRPAVVAQSIEIEQ